MSSKTEVNKKALNLITLFLVVGCVGLVYFLGNSVYQKYSSDEAVANHERLVKVKLRNIKKAQESYYQVNDYYASTWGQLTDFVANGNFYLTERKERVINVSFGVDKIQVSVDTIAGPFSVQDSLFSSTNYPNFNVEDLSLSPEGDPFILRTDTLEGISVFEVVDPLPVNPLVLKGEKDTLKIGSLNKVTTARNKKK